MWGVAVSPTTTTTWLLLAIMVAPLSATSKGAVTEGGQGETTLEDQGETGYGLPHRKGSQEELDQTCECARNWSEPCEDKLKEYRTSIINGECNVNFSKRFNRFRRSSSRSDVDEDTSLSLPLRPEFHRENICDSLTPIILVTTGDEERLTIGSAPSLLICRGSLGTKLRNFVVSDVDEVMVSSGAMLPRDSNIQIKFSNIKKQAVLMEEAFSVQVEERKPLPTRKKRALEESFVFLELPIQVEVRVERATKFELGTRSVVAPRVSLVFNNVKDIFIASNGIIPYEDPGSSRFEITNSSNVVMQQQALIAGVFKVKAIHTLNMAARAIEIGGLGGGEVSLEHILNVTLASESISLGPHVSLTINTVVFTHAARRAIQNVNMSEGILKRVVLTEVSGTGLDESSVCLVAGNVVTYDLNLESDGDQAAGCIEGRRLVSTHDSTRGMVDHLEICQVPTTTDRICRSDRCIRCNPDSPEPPTSASTTSTTVTTTVATTTIPETTTTTTTTTSTTTLASTTKPETTTTTAMTPSTTETTTTSAAAPTTLGAEDGYTFVLTNYTFSPNFYDMNVFDEEPSNETTILSSTTTTITAKEYLFGMPIYILIIIICTALVLFILIISYCIWTCYTNKKRDKYRLPREGRVTTFHNTAPSAHAIATSEPIFTLGSPPSHQRDMYVSFINFRPSQDTHNSPPDQQTLCVHPQEPTKENNDTEYEENESPRSQENEVANGIKEDNEASPTASLGKNEDEGFQETDSEINEETKESEEYKQNMTHAEGESDKGAMLHQAQAVGSNPQQQDNASMSDNSLGSYQL